MPARFRSSWLESHRVDISTLRPQDVVGVGHVLREVDSLVARLRDPDRAQAMNVALPRGILLWGPPGLGKTLIARYMARALGPDVPFYELSADELTPDRIRGTLRYLAGAHPRSVLYLDEIDSFGMNRDYGGHDPDTRQLLTATLAALDGLINTAGPVVIASSNRGPDTLDGALVRAGRFGFRVRFDVPDEAERSDLLALFARAIPCAPGVDWGHAARLTRDRTPADLRQIVDDSAGLALAAGREQLAPEDVLEAVRRGGDIQPEPAFADEVRRRIAVHEAGHVAICVALRGASWVHAVQVQPYGGTTSFGDERISNPQRPDDELRDALVVGFGGIAAEQAVLGEGSFAGSHDVVSTTELALERFGSGLTDDPAPISIDALGRNAAEVLKAALAAGLREQVAGARARAIEIVAANREPIGRFAGILVDVRDLTGDPLQNAIKAAGFVAVPGPG